MALLIRFQAFLRSLLVQTKEQKFAFSVCRLAKDQELFAEDDQAVIRIVLARIEAGRSISEIYKARIRELDAKLFAILAW